MYFQECLKLENSLIISIDKPRDAIARERGLQNLKKERRLTLERGVVGRVVKNNPENTD
jgi:hypothetical protein